MYGEKIQNQPLEQIIKERRDEIEAFYTEKGEIQFRLEKIEAFIQSKLKEGTTEKMVKELNEVMRKYIDYSDTPTMASAVFLYLYELYRF